MADAHRNFAVSAVATAPSPATSGTSLVITAGEGATRFPLTPPYNVVVCPAGTDPTPANAEVVRVTDRTSDTFTITRAQESSTARSIAVGDKIYAAITAKSFTDIEAVDAAAATGSLRTLGSSATQALAGNTRLDQVTAPTAAVSLNSQKITSLATPTASTDAATKAYADSIAAGLDPHASVKVATTANITLSGTQTIDGVAVVALDRVLVKNQTTTSANGIYVAAAGAWSRATDADTGAELTGGTFVFIEQGTVHAEQGWVATHNGTPTLGTDPITFTQFSSISAISTQRYVNAADYGVSTSATRAANRTALLAAIAAAAGKKQVYLPGSASVYQFDHIDPPGPAKLIGDGMGATVIDLGGTSGLTVSAFEIFSAGSDSAKVSLTANASKGALVLTTATNSGKGWAAGDYLLVRSTGTTTNAYWPGSQGQNDARRGEFVRILTVDSTTQVTIRAPLEDTYLTADTCYATKVTFFENCGAEGITFKNSSPLTGVAPLVTFRGCRNLEVDEVEVWGGDGPGFVIDACLDFDARVWARDLADDSDNARYGYGVLVWDGCQDGEVTVHAKQCRHAFTTGAAWKGIPRHITIKGEARECTGAAWDTHPEGEDLLFLGCHASQGKKAPGTSNADPYGFQIRNPRTTIKGAIVSQCYGSGIEFASTGSGLVAVEGQAIGCVVSDMHGIPGAGDGIVLRARRCSVKDCSVLFPVGDAVVNDAADSVIVGNTFRRATAAGAPIVSSANGVNAYIVGNVGYGYNDANLVSGTETNHTNANNTPKTPT